MDPAFQLVSGFRTAPPSPPSLQTMKAILFPAAFPKMHPTEYYQVLGGGQGGGWAEKSEQKHLDMVS